MLARLLRHIVLERSHHSRTGAPPHRHPSPRRPLICLVSEHLPFLNISYAWDQTFVRSCVCLLLLSILFSRVVHNVARVSALLLFNKQKQNPEVPPRNPTSCWQPAVSSLWVSLVLSFCVFFVLFAYAICVSWAHFT